MIPPLRYSTVATQHSPPFCSCPLQKHNAVSDSRVPWLCTRRLAHARRHYGVLDWLQVVLPMVGWLRTYNVRQFLLVRLPPPN